MPLQDIRSGVPVPKVMGRGKPKGMGKNLNLLAKMKVGDSIWGVSAWKLHSLLNSAIRKGIKLRYRKQPDTINKYIIWKMSEAAPDQVVLAYPPGKEKVWDQPKKEQ